MPIRTASLNKQIEKNGARLHQAMLRRVRTHGTEHAASEAEQALLDERRQLKQARAERQAQAKLPKPAAVKVVKEAKPPKAPKAAKEAKAPKEPKAAKSAKDHKPTRAEKQVKKAANLEAAKAATKKSAKT